jgi:predicted acylesterase/phospholipase RssA
MNNMTDNVNDALIRPTKLLNYMTAPDTVIWSALLASAAVPGILNPVVLMQKLKDGSIVPWSWGSRFKDGSLRYALPRIPVANFLNACAEVSTYRSKP